MTTSRAWLVDLIRAIGQKTAIVDHLEEMLNSGEDYDPEVITQLIEQNLELRREEMDLLLRNGLKPNLKFWCVFKHSVDSFTHDVEVYEANLTEEARVLMKKSADALAGATSLFLGLEFQTCERCLNDSLLMKQVTEEKSNGLE